jgi:DNA-binding XRE family transcriptional regulator
MTGSHVVSLLTTKYAKLLGEYEFAERMTEDAIGLAAIIEATNRCDARKKEIDEKLAAIETVIWLFDTNWNPATVKGLSQEALAADSGIDMRYLGGIERGQENPTVAVVGNIAKALSVHPSVLLVESRSKT